MATKTHKFSVQEAQNINLGQCSSMYIDVLDEDNTPPTGKVFVAVTCVSDTKFNDLTQETNTQCFGTAGTEAHDGPPGEKVTNADMFPAGLTLYGRWTKIDLDAGAVIAYCNS